jgi:hypothetical protein
VSPNADAPEERKAWMSPAKKRQTMGKVTRERELKERRALKQEKKEARRAAAAEKTAEEADGTFPPPEDDAEADAEAAD